MTKKEEKMLNIFKQEVEKEQKEYEQVNEYTKFFYNNHKEILNIIKNQQKEIAELKEEINYWKECTEGEAGLRKQIQEDYQQQMQKLLESED